MRKEIFDRTFGREVNSGDIAVLSKGYSGNHTRDYQTINFLNDQHLFTIRTIKTLLTHNVLMVERISSPTQTWNRNNRIWEYYSLEESSFIEDANNSDTCAMIMRMRIRRGSGSNDVYVPTTAEHLCDERLSRLSTYNANTSDQNRFRTETQDVANFFLDSHLDSMVDGGEFILIVVIDSIKGIQTSNSINFQRFAYLNSEETVNANQQHYLRRNAFGSKYSSCQQGTLQFDGNRNSISYMVSRRINNDIFNWNLTEIKQLLRRNKSKSMKTKSYFLDKYCASLYDELIHINDEYALVKISDEMQQGSGGETLDQLLRVNPDGGYSLSIVSNIEITDDGQSYMEIAAGDYRVVSKAEVSSLLDYRKNIPSTFNKILVSGIKHRFAAMFIIDDADNEEDDVSVTITPTLQEAVDAEEEDDDINVGSDWLNRLK